MKSKTTNQHDSKVVNDSLKKVAKGTIIVFIGLFIFTIFNFVARLLLIRNWSQSDFGIFSLAFTIITLLTTVSTLGFKNGIVRNIAYARGKKDKERITDLIKSSVILVIILSFFISIMIFLFSEAISKIVFDDIALILPLQIFSISIPILTLIFILTSIFRGFDNVVPQVIFHYSLLYLLFTAFIIIIIFLGLDFIFVIISFVIASLISLIILLFYTKKKLLKKLVRTDKKINFGVSKSLIFFSLPLLSSAIIMSLNKRAGILFLGSLKSSTEVALFSSVGPLSEIIAFLLSTMIVIYMPIISGLYSQGKIKEMKRNYLVLTKWLSFAALPIFLILVLYPNTILQTLFGPKYIPAVEILIILSFASMFNNFVGPCGSCIISIGKTRLIMYSMIISLVFNIVLAVILIPLFGIIGAAIATAVGVITSNIFKTWKLYKLSGIQPISKNLMKLLFSSLFFILMIFFATKYLLAINWWMLPIMLISFYLIEFICLIATRSIDVEDSILIKSLLNKVGIKSSFLEKIFKLR